MQCLNYQAPRKIHLIRLNYGNLRNEMKRNGILRNGTSRNGLCEMVFSELTVLCEMAPFETAYP